MITSETLVQTSADGACRMARDLREGDFIYDGFAGRLRKIHEVLIRAVDVQEVSLLQPVRLRWGVLGANCPAHDVLLSPQQAVMVRVKSGDAEAPGAIRTLTARELCIHLPSAPDYAHREVTYVSIFFASPANLICSGLVLPAYTSDMLIGRPASREAAYG